MGRVEEIDRKLAKLDSEKDSLESERENLVPKKVSTRGDPVVRYE